MSAVADTGGEHACRSARLAAHRGGEPFEVLTARAAGRAGVIICLAIEDVNDCGLVKQAPGGRRNGQCAWSRRAARSPSKSSPHGPHARRCAAMPG